MGEFAQVFLAAGNMNVFVVNGEAVYFRIVFEEACGVKIAELFDDGGA